MTEEQLIERLIRETRGITETERERLISYAKAADDAETAVELATDEEAEIVAELQAEEELWSEWNAQPRARTRTTRSLMSPSGRRRRKTIDAGVQLKGADCMKRLSADDIAELIEALRRLVIHDEAADWREGLPSCIELQRAIELLGRLEVDLPFCAGRPRE